MSNEFHISMPLIPKSDREAFLKFWEEEWPRLKNMRVSNAEGKAQIISWRAWRAALEAANGKNK